jgi:hypothetical protein
MRHSQMASALDASAVGTAYGRPRTGGRAVFRIRSQLYSLPRCKTREQLSPSAWISVFAIWAIEQLGETAQVKLRRLPPPFQPFEGALLRKKR